VRRLLTIPISHCCDDAGPEVAELCRRLVTSAVRQMHAHPAGEFALRLFREERR
jgi:hypothetical protein